MNLNASWSCTLSFRNGRTKALVNMRYDRLRAALKEEFGRNGVKEVHLKASYGWGSNEGTYSDEDAALRFLSNNFRDWSDLVEESGGKASRKG